MNEITPASLHEWMKKNRYRQAQIAQKLGTSATTVSRWLSGVHDIPSAEKKLLAYLMHGKLPFEPAHAAANTSNKLNFTAEEWRVIEILRRREGFENADSWIATKIRIYLAQVPDNIKEPHHPLHSPPIKNATLEASKSSHSKSA